MKIAVVFLLVAVSTSYGSVHESSGRGHDQLFLQNIVETDIPRVLKALQKLVCSYETCKNKHGKPNQCSLEEWTVMLKETKETLKDLGCSVDQIVLGGPPTVEEILTEVGKALETLRDPLRKLLVETLKIEQPVFDIVCQVLGDVLLKVTEILDLGMVVNLAAPVTNLGNGGLGGLTGK